LNVGCLKSCLAAHGILPNFILQYSSPQSGQSRPSVDGREMPVITALKSMTAIGKFLCQQPTHSSHSDMDLSFPIPVIGKVAISTFCGR